MTFLKCMKPLTFNEIFARLTEDERDLPVESYTGWECDSMDIVAAVIARTGDAQRVLMLLSQPVWKSEWFTVNVERVVLGPEGDGENA